MASKKTTATLSAENQEAKDKSEAYTDFDDFEGEVVARELDGTWIKEVGATIFGTISHAYTYVPRPKPGSSSEPVSGIALKITRPCRARQDGAEVTLDTGSLVGVTLHKKIAGVLLYQPGSTVVIRIDGATPLANGGRAWRSSMKIAGKRRPGGNELKPVQLDPEDADCTYHYEPTPEPF